MSLANSHELAHTLGPEEPSDKRRSDKLYLWDNPVHCNDRFQLVTLPYNLLLSKSARESLGIDLTNQVVIIDEAHSMFILILC